MVLENGEAEGRGGYFILLLGKTSASEREAEKRWAPGAVGVGSRALLPRVDGRAVGAG